MPEVERSAMLSEDDVQAKILRRSNEERVLGSCGEGVDAGRPRGQCHPESSDAETET